MPHHQLACFARRDVLQPEAPVVSSQISLPCCSFASAAHGLHRVLDQHRPYIGRVCVPHGAITLWPGIEGSLEKPLQLFRMLDIFCEGSKHIVERLFHQPGRPRADGEQCAGWHYHPGPTQIRGIYTCEDSSTNTLRLWDLVQAGKSIGRTT